MKYAIILSPEAIEDLRRLKAPIRSEVKQAMEIHLTHAPLKESKSRICGRNMGGRKMAKARGCGVNTSVRTIGWRIVLVRQEWWSVVRYDVNWTLPSDG